MAHGHGQGIPCFKFLVVCVGCSVGFLIVETIRNVSNCFYATVAFIKVAVSRGSAVYEIVLDTYYIKVDESYKAQTNGVIIIHSNLNI